MSEVWIRADEAERGSVPTRCAKGGGRCISRVRVLSSDLATPLEWATWSGLWPRSRGRQRQPLVLSMLPHVAGLHRSLTRARDVTTVLIVLLGLAALALNGTIGDVAGVAALVALAVKVVVAVVGMLWAVAVQPDTTGEWLLVSGVHAEFARATESVTTRPDTPPQRRTPAEAASPAMAQATAPDGS